MTVGTKRRRESGACTGRGFSMIDPDGYLAKLLAFTTRPNAHGTTTACVATNADERFAAVGHGLVTGDSVVLTGTTAPAGLTLSISIALPLTRSNITEYFAIRISDDIFQLASTRYLAMAGTALTFTTDGTAVSFTKLGGGAGWYLHDDFSMMVPKTFAHTDVDVSTDTITLAAHGFSMGHRVIFSGATLPTGITAGTTYWVYVVDANSFKLAVYEHYLYYVIDQAGGATYRLNITGQGTGTHTVTSHEHFVVVTDTASPTVNDYNTSPAGCAPKFLKLGYAVTEAGYCRAQGLFWWDKTTHIGQGFWSGGSIATYDSAQFAYQFIGGDEFLAQFSQLGPTWDRNYIDTFTGFSSKLEPLEISAGVYRAGVLQSPVVAGSSVALTLASGEGAKFTAGKYYYLYDFVGHAWCNYVKVTLVVGDVVTVDTITEAFPSGAVITPYAHRYYHRCSGLPGTYNNQPNMVQANTEAECLPYYSKSIAINTPSTDVGNIPYSAFFIDNTALLSVGTPDDEGNYDCVYRVAAERYDPDYWQLSNRIYGKVRNVLDTARGNMGWMTNTRTLLGVEYLNFYSGTSNITHMITYTESAV